MTDERATTKIDREKSHMYDEIIMDENSIFHSQSKTTVYVMSAALGYYFKESKNIPPSNRQDLFVTTTLGSGSADALWILKSIAISHSGIEILKSMRDIIKICDDYANSGIERLYKIHKDSDDEADDIAMLIADSLDNLIE
ncbi:hypothetical protein [Candidatus Methanarcanum hacksteinii]|uniref:hypothetical protein n=1 Tax=Candidatus Methanarcanum hacksteinii TaxID=2911857 RepID=UPI0037DD2149|nr:MAG: hypothetical protein A3204_01295 [Candidatus Methanarcanum hacksteinii]